jgi:7-alpha-hydroxysteroid dehydrogenase
VVLRTGEQIEEVAATIRTVGPRALPLAMDLGERDAPLALAAAVRDGLGPVDIVVNGAAQMPMAGMGAYSTASRDSGCSSLTAQALERSAAA